VSIRIALGVGLVLCLTSCEDPAGPTAAEDSGSTLALAAQAQQTGPSNRCYGQIVAGIAATWPWAHNNPQSFPPPPGALALWVRLIGPNVGISSVRELQTLFCG